MTKQDKERNRILVILRDWQNRTLSNELVEIQKYPWMFTLRYKEALKVEIARRKITGEWFT